MYDLEADPFKLKNPASKAGPELLAQLSARLNEPAKCRGEACRTAEVAPFDLPARFGGASAPRANRFGLFVGRQDTIAL